MLLSNRSVGFGVSAVMLGCASQVPPAAPAPACPGTAVQPGPAPSAQTGEPAILHDLPRSGELQPPLADLPGAASHEPVSPVLGVDIDASGMVYFAGKRLDDARDLTDLARKALANDPGARAIIRADRSVPWGTVIYVLDRLRQGGLAKLAFGVTPVPAGAP